MLVKIYIFLTLTTWNLMEIDASLQLIDRRDSSNEIPDFDREINNNLIEYDQPTTEPYPQQPYKPYKFEEEPDDIHAQFGTSIILNCFVSHTNGTVQWTKNNFGLGIDRDLMAYKRYSMIGDENSGNYSLHINFVNFKDEGFYQCQFSNQDVQMRSRYATVSIFNEDKIIKSGQICFSGVDNVGEVVMSERYEASVGHMIGSDLDFLNFAVIIGILVKSSIKIN